MRFLRYALQTLLPLSVVALGVLGMQLLITQKDEPEARPPEDTRPLVETIRVFPEDVRLSVRAQGTVVPRTESRLRAEVAGRVTWISPALVNGGFFEEGEHLLSIDPTDYELTAEEAGLAVAQAELRLAQEEADAEVARREWEELGRGEEPHPLTVREPQLAEARASLEAARARQRRAQRDVERCRIEAPYAGRVRLEQVDPGEYVMPGTELALIYAIDLAEVRLPLADAELAFLDLPLVYRGDETTFEGPRVDLHARFAGGDYRWEGRITRTEGELDPKSRMVVAVALVEDPYGRDDLVDRPPLSVGMFVSARIEGRWVEDVIIVPRHAVRGKNRVYVVDGDRLRFRDVRVLKADPDRIILASGLENGELVIVSPLEDAMDGMSVRLVDSEGGDASASER
ncbi:MAG: efflux RND transporter periplasmic adaptor subunit [Planctomycetota bacterium]|nr:efflux RND transporter periplasmic adaptor subunit [Planctomycetota bacterium]